MSQLFYTRDELFNQPHFRYLETESNIMFTRDDSKFVYYKKLYLLKIGAPDVTEIYVELKQYLVIKNYLEHSMSRWMNEFNAYVFWSIKDYIDNLEFANKNKLY